MDFYIRRVEQGDALTLATIQTTSWKAAFRNIISDEDLERCTNPEKVVAMYTRLLDEKIGNGYIGEVDGKAHYGKLQKYLRKIIFQSMIVMLGFLGIMK